MSILPMSSSSLATGDIGADAAAWRAAAERRVGDWRASAITLRQAAALVDQLAPTVAAFDRDDVWQGGVARAFRADLERWRHWLGGDGVCVAGELRAAADRIDARAGAVDTALTGACPAGS